MNQPRNLRRRAAFTLVEVLVALGIMAILLVIIVVPIRLGFDTFNVGKARSDTQSALQSTMTAMETDLRQAVYVFPNGIVTNVTDKAPYNGLPPYFRSLNLTTLQGACGSNTNVQNWANPARIDMVQVRRDSSGNVITPTKPSYTIVTYYARRQDMTQPYDPIDNPVVMYRAEYPAYAVKTSGAAPLEVNDVAGAVNAKIDFSRFVPGSGGTACDPTNAAITNRNALWLTHNVYGEANLEPLTNPAVNTTTYPVSLNSDALYSHTLSTPRGLALEASRAYRSLDASFDAATEAPLVPDTSFTETDTNKDGKIDRVTISLGLASFDVGAQGNLKNNQPSGTRLRATRTIDLPNIE